MTPQIDCHDNTMSTKLNIARNDKYYHLITTASDFSINSFKLTN